MSELTISSNCTGYGGLDIAVQRLFGGRVVSYSDIDPGPIAVMAHRHPGLSNLGDIKLINPYLADYADVWTGGYPCQPFSNAGKRLGTDDPRHIWPWISTILGATRPRIVVLENVAAHLKRGFDIVSADLASLGYVFAWTVVRASDIGAPHQRRRLFIVAVAEDAYLELGEQWRQSAPGQAQGRGARADARRRSGVPAPEPESQRRASRRAEPARLIGGPDAVYGGLQPERWGAYADAIARWESIRGLRAPDPTITGARGGQVLSPLFVEWMMGLEPGWVTDTPGLTRNAMLKLLGNGVVPQQAEYAIRGLWARLMALA